MSKQHFLAQDFYHKHLCANVYKMYECDKNQMFYCNIESFKKSNFSESLSRHWQNMAHIE